MYKRQVHGCSPPCLSAAFFNGDLSCADDLADAVRAEHIDEILDFLRLASDLVGDEPGRDVHGLRADEDVYKRQGRGCT